VVGLTIVIVVVLLWFANFAQPVQLADVTPQLDSSLYIGLFAVTAAGHVDHGSVPLQVTGTLNESGAYVTVLDLVTRPSGASRWQKQPVCCTILGSSPMGSSFTGSANLSVASAQTFDFHLVSGGGDNTVLATGTLAVHLESFPGGSQLAINIIGGLGAMGTLLGIWGLVPERRTAAEPAPSPMQGDPDA
jgi:hypothetical protein